MSSDGIRGSRIVSGWSQRKLSTGLLLPFPSPSGLGGGRLPEDEVVILFNT